MTYQTQIIVERRARLVKKSSPTRGVLCAPFWMFTPVLGCNLGCHYCFLQLTLRLLPGVRVTQNINEGLKQLERTLERERKMGRRVMVNIGELADGRSLEPALGVGLSIMEVLSRHPNGMLYVLSKTGVDTIGNYLSSPYPVRHRVIHAASVNPQTIIDMTEEKTGSLSSRLEALRLLKDAGYRLRVRIDPIFDLRHFGASEAEAFGEYAQLSEMICELRPEMVTMGAFRPFPSLLGFIRRKYPDSPVLRAQVVSEGWKKRVLATRLDFYRFLAPRFLKAGIKVSLCKEPLSVWNAVGLSPNPLECSCLPFANERAFP